MSWLHAKRQLHGHSRELSLQPAAGAAGGQMLIDRDALRTVEAAQHTTGDQLSEA